MAEILGISGGHSLSSTRRALVEFILAQLKISTRLSSELIDLTQLEHSLDEQYFIDRFIAADVIVVGSTIVNNNHLGVFKQVFECINPKLLSGKTVLISGTGTSYQQAKFLENQLRPLLTIFGARAVPTSLFARECDFIENELINLIVKDQIGEAVVETMNLLSRAIGNPFTSVIAA